MSKTYEIVCHSCKERLWVAQESSTSHHIYATPEAAQDHADFLFKHKGHDLGFIDSENVPDDYSEFIC